MSVPDPRTFPSSSDAAPLAARLHTLAEASLAATTGQVSAARDAEIAAAIRALLLAGDGEALAALFTSAPSVSVYRQLWRSLAERERALIAERSALATTPFAIPVIVVAARDTGGDGRVALPGALDDPAALAAILREHGALRGNQTFALAGTLVGADAFDVERLPNWLAATTLRDTGDVLPMAVQPVPIDVSESIETVHLRFVAGTALAAPGVDLLSDGTVGGWGMPMATALARQLTRPGVTVLALPRAPQSLVTAVHHGRAAQREVTAQLFAANAIRKLRASVGEPIAVISAHRNAAAPGGGELRLSLSSPFDPREAEGFRCPLYAADRVGDVVTMLVDLLRDCRVTDIRTLAGVHADRDPETGLTLLFKPETIPAAARVTTH